MQTIKKDLNGKLPIGKNGAMVQTYLSSAIDDHSRYLVHSRFYDNQEESIVEDTFQNVLLKAGACDAVYFDNGSQYAAKQLKFSLARLGITVRHAKVRSGKSKGKIEKFHQAADAFLREARIHKVKTLEELNRHWKNHLEEYCHTGRMVAAMYKAFYEMQRLPFVRDILSGMLYESPAMADTLGRLSYAADRQLFAVVTADARCGKSTLVRRFVETLPKEEYIFLYLSDSKLTPRWFYKGMLDQMGVESKFCRGDAKRQLQKEVEIIRGVQGRKVVRILDEAHLLGKETIEEFRFLLNYKFDSMSPMALVLVGQTELWDKLRLQRYAAVRQRIDLSCILPHLDRAQTERNDISGQLEDLQEHMDNVSSKLRRFKSPHAKQYEVVKAQGVLPFD